MLAVLPSFDTEIKLGRNLQEAKSVLEASTRRFDLILLDLGLPDSQGLNTIEAIQAITDIKILLITGQDTMPQEILDDHDIKGYLPKSKMSIDNLDSEIQITMQTMNFRRSRERFALITSNLEKLVDKAYNIESENTKQ